MKVAIAIGAVLAFCAVVLVVASKLRGGWRPTLSGSLRALAWPVVAIAAVAGFMWTRRNATRADASAAARRRVVLDGADDDHAETAALIDAIDDAADDAVAAVEVERRAAIAAAPPAIPADAGATEVAAAWERRHGR